MKNWAFYRQLHSRGMNTTKLAEIVDTSRSHLTEVLNNKPGHGGKTTRRALFEVLPIEEIKSLGWYWQYRAWRREQKKGGSTGNNVPMLSGGVR